MRHYNTVARPTLLCNRVAHTIVCLLREHDGTMIRRDFRAAMAARVSCGARAVQDGYYRAELFQLVHRVKRDGVSYVCLTARGRTVGVWDARLTAMPAD